MSLEKIQTTTERLRFVRQSLRLSPALFAAALGEKAQRVQDIERNRQRPPEEYLRRVVEHFHVDGTWLLTGGGIPFRSHETVMVEPDGTTHEAIGLTSDGACDEEIVAWRTSPGKARTIDLEVEAEVEAGVDTSQDNDFDAIDDRPLFLNSQTSQQEQAILVELGLQDLYLKARRGQQELSWSIIRYLSARRKPAAWRDILVGVMNFGTPVTELDLRSDLAVLVHRGLVVQEKERYRLATANPALSAREPADISQATKDAVKRLVLEIVPVAERADGTGYVLDAVGRIKPGSELEFVERIKSAVRSVCLELQDDNGQPVHLVLGVALDATAQIKHKVGEE